MTPEPLHRSSAETTTGVLCGVGAGALWGLVFLAPALVANFSPLQLTVGRYLAYGLIAGILIAPRWRAITPHLRRRDWLALFGLGLVGNTLYYILLSTAVQTGGIAMTSLVIGFLPVTVTIVGSRDHGSAPLRKLYLSLFFCTAGALCIGWQALAAPTDMPLGARLIGFGSAVGALVAWTGFAVVNARALKRLNGVTSHDWNLLTGVVTGAQSLVLAPFAFLAVQTVQPSGEWMKFIAVSVAVAVFASIVGNGLWNRMSRLLPLTLVGQMILFETLFALIYGFVWETRWPTTMETVAFVLVVLSVVTCLHAHRAPKAIAEATPS